MLQQAEAFARKAHEGQTRKAGGPFIDHPIEVAHILQAAGCSEEVVAAGFLHDVIEDTTVTAQEILEAFNDNTLRLVLSNTEDKSKSWLERKAHTHHQLLFSPLDERCVLIADKLANLKALVFEEFNVGHVDWSKFKYGYNEQKWYFTTIANACLIGLTKEELEQVPSFFHQYISLCHNFFQSPVDNL